MNVSVFIQKIFGSATWKIPCAEPTLFLTFDDGPVPEVTPDILDILKRNDAKATFFCIGENVEKYPEVYKRIVAEGHAVGNHTYRHLNGWKTSADEYAKDVALCDTALSTANCRLLSTADYYPPPTANLFRPPYGKLNWSQYSTLKSDYSIIMWNVLSKDYDEKISGEICLRNVSEHATSGSIIVFHDSVKARERVLYALPKVLEHFSKQNFSFKSISK